MRRSPIQHRNFNNSISYTAGNDIQKEVKAGMKRKDSFDAATAFASEIHTEYPKETLNKEINSTFYLSHQKGDFQCQG